ncbi:MAG: SpoIIE family protein phosphatase [Armatimonadetes bacterium]|nr:SpoIIE family protein phosphatase [Armatimonadota bacterium]
MNKTMGMNLKPFTEEITDAHARMADLRDLVGEEGAQRGGLLADSLQELGISLEELRVAEEELHAQNEELGRTRLAVEEEHRRYQDLFDSAPDAYLVTNIDGRILEANRAAGRLLGIQSRHLARKPLAAYVTLESRQDFRSRLRQMQQEDARAEWEVVLRPRRGAALPAALSVSAVRGRDGAPIGLRWLVRDITERKNWEARLQQMNAELERRVQERTAELEAAERRSREQAALVEALLSAAPVGFALLDRDLRYVRVNPALARLNGLPAEAHQGRRPADVIGADAWRAREPLCRRALAGEAVLDQDLSGESPAYPGEIRHFLVSYYPVPTMGEATGVGVVVRDITERKRAELAQGRDLDRTRRIADALQTALLQTVSENAFPGLAVSTLYKAASDEARVGGDFFDAFTVDSGKVALVVGDVSGKGLSAATHTTEIKFALRAFLRETPQPGRALARLNDFVCEAQRQDDWGNTNMVVLALALIEPNTGEVTYTSAGSEPLLALPPPDAESDAIQEVGLGSGLILGVSPGQRYRETTFRLPPGGMLLMATDGITEARRPGGPLLGLDGLKRLARACRDCGSVGEISRSILDGARAFASGPLADDACILLAQRR